MLSFSNKSKRRKSFQFHRVLHCHIQWRPKHNMKINTSC